VQCVTMLVTPDGEWVFENSPEFRAALGDPDPDPDYDATLFAVKNLGFIKFEMLGKSVIEIELHPRNVELRALLAVQHQLQLSSIPLFRIKYLDTGDWCSEIMYSTERVISRLAELCSKPTDLPLHHKFHVEPQDYSCLFYTENSPLRLMAQKWRMAFGCFDPSLISFAINHQLLSRTVIVGVNARNADPIFRFIGEGHENWLDREYQYQVIGEKVRNLPDKEYGGWASEFYRSVAATGRPRYDIVTAAIQCPTQRYVTRYERLLLPWKTASEEVLVTLWSRPLRNSADAAPATSASRISSMRKLARSA
jgi:hypothetical protein